MAGCSKQSHERSHGGHAGLVREAKQLLDLQMHRRGHAVLPRNVGQDVHLELYLAYAQLTLGDVLKYGWERAPLATLAVPALSNKKPCSI